MLCVPVQNRLKGKCREILLSFTEKNPNFMLHTTITIIHVEYQKLFISFIVLS